MDQYVRDQGFNAYSEEGLRAKTREWMRLARLSEGSARRECVMEARANWRKANSLAALYRQYPDIPKAA